MKELLKHNNSSMKTEVELFIIEETQDLIYDNEKLDQWNNLVSELGLTGQTQVVKTDKSPIPFLWMNQALVKTFEELCPTKIEIAKYSKTPIPVEALSVVSLSKNENYFDIIEVWYNEKNPDPAIIGYKYDDTKTDTWSRKFYANKYLLARWSDVKASLSELTARAKQHFILRRSDELKKSIISNQRELDDIELHANTQFGFADETIVGLPF